MTNRSARVFRSRRPGDARGPPRGGEGTHQSEPAGRVPAARWARATAIGQPLDGDNLAPPSLVGEHADAPRERRERGRVSTRPSCRGRPRPTGGERQRALHEDAGHGPLVIGRSVEIGDDVEALAGPLRLPPAALQRRQGGPRRAAPPSGRAARRHRAHAAHAHGRLRDPAAARVGHQEHGHADRGALVNAELEIGGGRAGRDLTSMRCAKVPSPSLRARISSLPPA
jgi:hypothetical protein